MRDPGGLGFAKRSLIQNPVLFNDSPPVAQDRERPRVRLQPTRGLLGIVLRNDQKDGVSALDFVVGLLQLPELRFAEWSPRPAADELQDHAFALELREPVTLSSRVFELEVRGGVSDLGPIGSQCSGRKG